jgi:hypothetical protein
MFGSGGSSAAKVNSSYNKTNKKDLQEKAKAITFSTSVEFIHFRKET